MDEHAEHGNVSSPTPNGNHSYRGGAGSTGAAQTSEDKQMSCLQKVSNKITGALEGGFERLGLSIGHHPIRFMIGCVLGCLLCGLGLIAFNEVSDPDDLWVPKDSQVLEDQDWIDVNFPSNVRREQIIAESSNILTPTSLAALLDIYENSLIISTSGGITLSNVCLKAGSDCVVYSILEIWQYNSSTIRSLSQDDIINAINTVTLSPMYGNAIDISTYLGTRTTNSSGSIIAAQAAIMTWLTNGAESMESTTESWEGKFIDLGLAGHSDIPTVYVMSGKSWQEESGKAIDGDVSLLSAGYFLVIVFVVAVLGKLNFMEQRAWLTLGGFICIGLAILVSIGLSSAFQQGYGPLQSVLPFLLLGIGVDDMFVIMGSLNNLKPEEQNLEIPVKIAQVLRHAGVSITVTSFTDFVAFMVGATTIIPALRSFCIYAAIGILALYVLQAIFFTACLTLDLKRIEKRQDGCCFCCVTRPSPPYVPNECSQKQFVPYAFKRGLAHLITKLPFKIVVTVIAVTLLGVNIWGFVELELYFDRNWFLPDDSYARDFTKAQARHYPEDGFTGYVYCGNLDYFERKNQLESLGSLMDSSSDIYSGSTDSWFTALTSWLSTTNDTEVISLLDSSTRYPLSEEGFQNLTYRLTTEQATRTSNYIKFASASNLDITASRFPFRHIELDDSSSEISAMDNTRALVETAGFSNTECFPYSRAYLGWETNKVIREELLRNLGLALICVFIVTLILIANVRTSLLVFLCVLCTLVDVAGTMHFWNLTIDTVTSIILILSIGLAVDYSAHIGHMFMTITGTRRERAKETLGEMGPCVFYGGFSTFLAFILLSNSNSYVFSTFFKVNFLVVLYGLFHGLVFLPVLLSWMGPPPYPTADRSYKHHHHPEGVEATSNSTKVVDGTLNHAYVASESDQGNGYAMQKMSQTSGEASPNRIVAPPGESPPPDYSTAMAENSMTTVQT